MQFNFATWASVSCTNCTNKDLLYFLWREKTQNDTGTSQADAHNDVLLVFREMSFFPLQLYSRIICECKSKVIDFKSIATKDCTPICWEGHYEQCLHINCQSSVSVFSVFANRYKLVFNHLQSEVSREKNDKKLNKKAKLA